MKVETRVNIDVKSREWREFAVNCAKLGITKKEGYNKAIKEFNARQKSLK